MVVVVVVYVIVDVGAHGTGVVVDSGADVDDVDVDGMMFVHGVHTTHTQPSNQHTPPTI